MPNIPTIAESGLEGYEFTGWFGIWAPASTPTTIVLDLNRAIVKTLNEADVRSQLEKDGAQILAGSPEDFDRYINSEYTKWNKIIKAANIHVD